MSLRVVALNRYLPPRPGVTGALLWRLLAGLKRRWPDIELNAIGTDLAYGTPEEAVPELPVKVTRIPSLQGRWGSVARPLATLHDGWRMARAAAVSDAASGAEVVISLTDPPMLGHWLSATLRRDQFWIEWSMDLFPEALWAATRGRPRAWPPLPGRAPDLRLCLGPKQAEFLNARGGTRPPHLILPAGIAEPPAPGSAGVSAPKDGPVRLVHAGNMGRAHPVDGFIALARALDPARHRWTVHAHGAGAARFRAATAHLTAVEWSPAPLSRDELMAADVHVSGLRREWSHVSAPSKAVTALCLGKPVLFLGAAESDAWRWAAGGAGDGAGWRVSDDGLGVADALAAISSREALAVAAAAAVAAGNRLRESEERVLDDLARFPRERRIVSVPK